MSQSDFCGFGNGNFCTITWKIKVNVSICLKENFLN
nr:MAG TPA: hypothetical protein [Caudoviricetes sp.]